MTLRIDTEIGDTILIHIETEFVAEYCLLQMLLNELSIWKQIVSRLSIVSAKWKAGRWKVNEHTFWDYQSQYLNFLISLYK